MKAKEVLLDELVSQYQELRRQGQSASPEEVCTGHPALLDDFKDRLRVLGEMEAFLDLDGDGSCANETSRDSASAREARTDQSAGPKGAAPLPVVPGYQIEAELGQGGMGVVYRAWQLTPRRCVALKMIRGGHTGAGQRARFLKEVQAQAELEHPNVVRVYEVGEHEGQPYFSLEYVAGGSLDKQLGGTPQPAERAAAWLETLARAMHAAHAKGVVHRDLKPANVLLAADGTLKVADFGLAKLLQVSTEGAHARGLTPSGAVMGTPSYMAPEQAQGRTQVVSAAADVYALGAILYECLTGRPPFRGETLVDTLQQVLTQEPVSPRRLNPGVPRDLETVCLKCLEKDPDRRYPSALALAEDVRRYRESRPIVARPVGWPGHAWRWVRRNPREAAITGLVLLLVVLGGGAAWWSRQQRAEIERRQAVQALQWDTIQEAVERDLARMPQLYQNFRWDEAKAVLELAMLRLRDTDLDGLREKVRQAERERAMAAELDRIRLDKSIVVDGELLPGDAVRGYRKAFAAFGLDLETGDAAPARLVADSAIKEQLLEALDDWAYYEKDDSLYRHLLAVAREADPNAWRNKLRDPETRRDPDRLVGLAGQADVKGQSPALLTHLGLSLWKHPAGLSLLRQAQQSHPNDFWLVFSLCTVLQHRGERDEILRYYQAALALRPQSEVVHNNLGSALRACGQLDQAITAFEEALRLNPDFVMAHANLGSVFGIKGQLDKAGAAFREALRLKGDLPEAHFGLGKVLKNQGRLDEAAAAYSEALRLRPDYADAHSELGVARQAQGKVTEAAAAFRNAVRSKPDLAEAHNNLGSLLHAQGDLDGAAAAYREALRRNKDYPRALHNLGLTLLAQGRADEAEAAHRQALGLDKGYADACYSLGNALRSQGKLEEAIIAYRAALRLRDDFAEASCNLGLALLFQGQFTEARTALQRGHQLGARSPQWRYPSAQWVRECERLSELERRLPAVLESREQPRDAVEQLDFAKVCFCKKRFAATCRLYTDPSLPAPLPRGHIFDAACAALQAAAGKGVDAADLGDQERVRLRQQALHWLQGELKVCSRMLEKDDKMQRRTVQSTLRSWKCHVLLAGVRDETALANLPREEQQAWRQFWADAATLLQR